MGLFFSNLHICKKESFTAKNIHTLLTDILRKQGFRPVKKSEEADVSVSLYDSNGKWFSVYSDGIDFYTDESIREICTSLSERLSTEVLTVSCFDSDCLLLNMINRKCELDIFAVIGNYPEINRRSAPDEWNGFVDDFSEWKSVFKRDYTFAEDALDKIEPLLGLKPRQGRLCNELITEEFSSEVETYYYALFDSVSKYEPPKLTIPRFSLTPCEIGEENFISVVNTGGQSKGLAVAFSGSYVENEEIKFKNVRLEYNFGSMPESTIQLKPEKRQLNDGKWIYYAEIPSFTIPEKVKEGLPPRKAIDEEFRREFGIRFTPIGNKRKALDITVHFIPLENPEGQCAWCVWLLSGSKRKFIEEYNADLKAHQPLGENPLNENDFDID